MRTRALVGIAVAVMILVQATGCGHCCGNRESRSQDVRKSEDPLPAIQPPGPNAPVPGVPKQTGAYGGVDLTRP